MTEHAATAYTQIIAGLRNIGYRDALLEEDYGFVDWFAPNGQEKREIAAAAFGQTPIAYDSALIGIALANGIREQHLIDRYRSLGAPVILEIDADEIREWAVSEKPQHHTLIKKFPHSHVGDLLESRADLWKPEAFLRSKNLGEFYWGRQLELFSGLIPELEGQIQTKLDPLLRETLWRTKQAYYQTTNRDPDESKLFQLVFWLLTAKVFKDRRLEGFESLGPDPDNLLGAVARHYNSPVPSLLTKDARLVAAQQIWTELDFRNLSVEVLSHIWSTTLIDPGTTKRLGIHRTSRTIVRYIVDRIPFDIPNDDDLLILEPCAGSAVFLIGAMNRLRQMWFGTTPQQRHKYFQRHLAAIERDPFGVEISRLALTLADFPNPNGWNIQQDDVFMSEVLPGYLRRASVVLCNPPFGDFDDDERARYPLSSTKKPVELLNRVLDHLHPQGIIGFVLPRLFIDGRGYSGIRKRLAERFAELHVTLLPDRAFDADSEIALLIASEPIAHSTFRVFMHKVNDAPEDWRKFRLFHEVSAERSLDIPVNKGEQALPAADLPNLWEFLEEYPTMGDIALLSRGLEWNEALTIGGRETGTREKYIKDKEEVGYMRGVAPRTRFTVFEIPRMSYLSVKPKDQRVNAYLRDWKKPKAILNKAARSRGHWRMAAFPDTEGVTCYQTFIGVWPTSDRYDEWILSAILNSPVANAFVSSREGKTDVTIETLRLIPVPRFSDVQAFKLRDLIKRYQQSISSLMHTGGPESLSERLLKEIDALVLDAYRMPARLERALLDYFAGEKRSTLHSFSDYIPENCDFAFSLSRFLSLNFGGLTADDLLRKLGNR